MNNRRKLLIVIGTAAFSPRMLVAQSKQPVLIGWLHTDSRELGGEYLSAFKEGLATLGLKEGSQLVIDERWANGRTEPLPSLAGELAARSPTIIVAGNPAAVRAAVKAAPKTAIVMASGGNPVAMGFAKSLSHPGGMVTGLASLQTTLAEKYVEFLLAVAPNVRRIGVLIDSNAPGRTLQRESVSRAVAQYRVEVRFADVARPEEIEPAIMGLARDGARGLIVSTGLMVRNEQKRILKLAMDQRWPLVTGAGGWAEAGALLTYSADTLANYRRAAYYVDRILKGAKPSDLPIEQPTRFEFVANLKTAKLLGLTIPPEIMVQATRVIE